MNAAFTSLEQKAGQRKLIMVRSRLPTGCGVRRKRTSVTLPPASTAPYGMNAAFMRLGRHERGIHALSRVGEPISLVTVVI
jgi:hypothetical protein